MIEKSIVVILTIIVFITITGGCADWRYGGSFARQLALSQSENYDAAVRANAPKYKHTWRHSIGDSNDEQTWYVLCWMETPDKFLQHDGTSIGTGDSHVIYVYVEPLPTPPQLSTCETMSFIYLDPSRTSIKYDPDMRSKVPTFGQPLLFIVYGKPCPISQVLLPTECLVVTRIYVDYRPPPPPYQHGSYWIGVDRPDPPMSPWQWK